MNENELKHPGVKGMRWGIRRYQNYDGTLINPKGQKKYNDNRDLLPYFEKRATNQTKLNRNLKIKNPRKNASTYEGLVDLAGSLSEIPQRASARKKAKIRKKNQKIFRQMARELPDDQLRSVVNRISAENKLEQEFSKYLTNTNDSVSRLDGVVDNLVGLTNIGISLYGLSQVIKDKPNNVKPKQNVPMGFR